MGITDGRTAADRYAARVDAVLAQRTRLRGPQPPGDLWGDFPADHPLLKSDPRRALDPNLEVIASYIEPNDVIVDVGGGGGRVSLPLALRCREVIDIDPSPAMGRGFAANAAAAGITNARFVDGEWLAVDTPSGTVALVTHVTYLTRDIVPFVKKLETAARRRVIITVNSPPPPSWNHVIYQLVHGEAEEIVPGHEELVNVLWELGILPDIRVLPHPILNPINPAPTREAAIGSDAVRLLGDQWAVWPPTPDLVQRLRHVLETRFDDLFAESRDGFVPRWVSAGREVLITWRPHLDWQAH